jgi:gliding motility-associated-like protein
MLKLHSRTIKVLIKYTLFLVICLPSSSSYTQSKITFAKTIVSEITGIKKTNNHREVSTEDNDKDGINNIVDLDDDNDGILDKDEDLNLDLDNNPITNPSDSDGDGIPNYFDLDSDGDGIPDYKEAGGTSDPDGNGQPGIGILDSSEVNAVGIPLAVSPDSSITGTTTTSILAKPDADLDSVKNFLDKDSDNDGIVDAIEAGGTDADGDGEFGIGTENDIDADGLADIIDPYDDRDGNLDTVLNPGNALPIPDTDADSKKDYLDLDSDNDTIPDNVEAQSTVNYIAKSGTDTDKDGIDNAYDIDCTPCTSITGSALSPVNTDTLGNPDYIDLDSDNDVLYDIIEAGNESSDIDNDGKTNGLLGNNGLDNLYDAPGFGNLFLDPNGILDDTQTDNFPDTDADVLSGGDLDYRDILDSDKDGTADAADLDDDNDGVLDTQETPGNVNPDNDTDNDRIPDFRDPDFGTLNANGIVAIFDTDSDGLANHLDADSDNDNCLDVAEAGHIESTTKAGEVAGTGYNLVDGKVIGAETAYVGGNPSLTSVGIPAVINTQPTDQSGFVSGSVKFNIVSTGNIFQWQQSTNGGTIFTDIVNGVNFEGATANELTVSNLTFAENGNLYKVIVSNTDYLCGVVSSSPAIVTVNNNPPIAVDNLGVTTPEDTAITIATIAANDTDVEDTTPDSSTIILVDPNNTSNTGVTGTPLIIPSIGNYTVDVLGNVVFTPVLNYNGPADINYTVKDSNNSLSNLALIEIEVISVNDAPVANNKSVIGIEEETLTISTIGDNDTDVEGTLDPTSIILIDPNNTSNIGNSLTPLVIVDVGAYTVDVLGTVIFTPIENFNGSADINYTIKDGESLVSNVAVLGFTSTPVNDAPIAMLDTNNIEEDTELNVNATEGILKNDFDVDGDFLTVLIFNVNSTDYNAGSTASLTEGTLIINVDGSYIFTPEVNYNGVIPLVVYTITDGFENVTSTLDITVIPVNDAPIAINDIGNRTPEGIPITVSTINANDTDIDGTTDASTILLIDPSNVTNTGNSITSLIIADVGEYVIDSFGNVTFTPEGNFIGNAVINYTIEDNLGLVSNEAEIVIEVLPDYDSDGIFDDDDLDDDNDGIPDAIETNIDTDDDGIPDYLDLDSDGDGITDLKESGSEAIDSNNDGVIDSTTSGFGNNGLFDGLETFINSGVLNYNIRDTDSDNLKDFQDIDDDDDGINTVDEGDTEDFDNDGVLNYLDNDDDGDGILTASESTLDCDEDFILDHLDITNCALIPEGFSPNGDGVNETLIIPAVSNYPNFRIEIFNRYGNKVYDYSNKGSLNPTWWNGYSTASLTLNSSKPLPVGTYYYIVYFNKDNKKPITGWTYLNR